jgi:CTP:molybdopterin cytidylyltransferase MocA
MTQGGFTAVVLGADRSPDDPLVRASGACCKALVKINGTPMLQQVVNALESSEAIERIVVSGPQRQHLTSNRELQKAVESGRILWLAPQQSPSSSAFAAMSGVAADVPVLITTADHPLLRAEYVDHFLDRARAGGADVAVALVRFADIQKKFPHARKTVLRFRDGGYCGCNLFAFMTAESRHVADIWRKVEQQRKNPLRIVVQLGWWSVLRYLLGRLDLESAMQQLSARFGVRIEPVILPFPEAAIDVDSVADQALVEGISGSSR